MIITNELGTPQLNTVHHCDALRLLGNMASRSVDAIISDPPYNMTELAFDQQAIDWQAFWVQARRVLKCKNSPVILFSQQPFTTDLIMSNRAGWRYEIIWEKSMAMGFLDANRRPLRAHENIQIFADALPDYEPQMELSNVLRATSKRAYDTAHYNADKGNVYIDNGSRYPRSVWKFNQNTTVFNKGVSLHPTAKPLALMEKLMLTYTQPGWLIVDPFAGSGTTGAAARNTGRDYIMCELEPDMTDVARKRLSHGYTPMFAEMLA